jgi:hypothetical protein
LRRARKASHAACAAFAQAAPDSEDDEDSFCFVAREAAEPKAPHAARSSAGGDDDDAAPTQRATSAFLDAADLDALPFSAEEAAPVIQEIASALSFHRCAPRPAAFHIRTHTRARAPVGTA